MTATSPELHRSMGLSDHEYAIIERLMGRAPSLTELGMFGVMWSEHCGYKHSRPVLAYFRRYRQALEGDGLENAGIVDIGDGLGVTMKVESHNHPSAVEPYQGAATGVGGILRDILTMGARPIAFLDSLRFGPLDVAEPEIARRNRYLFTRVVEGIGGYGNCVGVPTVAGEVAFHERYSGNPLVNAMCVGLLRLEYATTAAASGHGNPVIYLGAATGKDGIHGATFASDVLDDESASKRPNVQIGDPFAGKLLIEATLEALRTGAVVAIQDMGAAGLTCSTIEMAAKGKVGMEIDLDRVPMREADMSAYELMLSESQERMLCVAAAGRESEVIDAFRRWGLKAELIGRVVEESVVRVRRHGRIEAEVDPRHLADQCPTYELAPEEPAYHRAARAFDPTRLPPVAAADALRILLGSPSVASKRFVWEQYDHQVQTQTVLLPGRGDAAVISPRGTVKGLAVKIDGNGRHVYFDPYVGGVSAVCEACRNVACVGARPVAITDGLNYGNPELPHVAWQFERSVRGIADASEALNVPVVSGNVSFYNQSDLGEVLPTPMIGALGVLDRADDRIGMALAPGLRLAVVGYPIEDPRQDGLGASEWLKSVHDVEDGLPVAPSLTGEATLVRALPALAAARLIRAAHDVSEGGMAVAIAEMAIVGGVGARVDLRQASPSSCVDGALFGEWPGRVVVAYDAHDEEAIRALIRGLVFIPIGVTGGDRLVAEDAFDRSVAELAAIYEDAIPSRL
jgi:phosphoribosylformylglycinamidine synthase